jgi:uncharacterized protein
MIVCERRRQGKNRTAGTRHPRHTFPVPPPPEFTVKLHQNPRATTHLVTGFGDGYLQIGDRRLTRTAVLAPGTLLEDWGAGRLEDLTADNFLPIAKMSVQIVLLGTGPVQQFPHPSLLRPLIDAGIGVEVMDTLAAARTYNILVAEGRAVAAILMLPDPTP